MTSAENFKIRNSLSDSSIHELEKSLDPQFLNVDPLKDAYRSCIVLNPEHKETLQTHHTALLVIDVQYLDAARGHGIFADEHTSGVPIDAQEFYFTSLETIVLPNIRRLQECFRAVELEVIHTRIQSLTQNGRDRSFGHKRLDILAVPGSKEAEFLEEVAPVGDEIVINKTASGVFTSTNLFYVLKNMKIEALFIAGVYTNECVSTTVRDASDLGFFVTLIEDACTTVTPELHNSSITTLRDRYARILNTETAVSEITSSMQSRS